MPLGESAPVFPELKVKIDNGEMLIVDEYEDLHRLVRMAKDWERAWKARPAQSAKKLLQANLRPQKRSSISLRCRS